MANLQTKKNSLLQKDFLLAVLSGGLFITINFSFFAIGPLYMLQEGYSEFMAGLQNTLFAIFCVVFRFYFGPLADIKGRRAMMLLGSLGFLLGSFLFYVSQGSFAIIVLARVSMGVGMASFLSAISCFVSELVTPESRGLAIGVQRGVYSIGLMTGPVGAMALVNGPFGFRGLFLVLSFCSLLMCLMVFLLKETYETKEEKVQIVRIVRESARLVIHPQIGRIFALILLISIGYGAILSFAAIYLSGFPVIPNIGLFFTFYSLGGLMGNIAGGVSVNRFNPARATAVCASLFGLSTALLYLVPFAPLVMIFLCPLLGGISFSANLVIGINWLIVSVPEDLKGTVLSLQENCMDGGFAIGSFVFGLMTLWATHQTIFLILGISGIVLPVLLNRSGIRLSSGKKEEKGNATSHNN